jgi:hypothetical protein
MYFSLDLKQVEELLSHKAEDFEHEDFFKLWVVLFFGNNSIQ